MSFVEQLSQLIVVVAVLILAYFGVMIWTRKSAKGGGGGLFGSGPSAPVKPLDLGDDTDFATEVPKKGHNRNKGRFHLQGKDAEVAAKVLKRMLKQGGDSAEQ